MSDSVWSHSWQPTRLPCPWDSPGKNTRVGCHFPLQCMKVKSLSCVRLLATPWTAAYQEPPSMGFSRQEYWSGVPLPSPRVSPCTRNGQQRAPQEQLLKAGQWKRSWWEAVADPVPNLFILDHHQAARGNGTLANHVPNPFDLDSRNIQRPRARDRRPL